MLFDVWKSSLVVIRAKVTQDFERRDGPSRRTTQMPEVGVEPTLAEANTALNRARLPIPPLRRVGREGRGDYHEANARTAMESGRRPAARPRSATF